MARSKRVHVLIYGRGNDSAVIGVFRKRPTIKKLAEMELAEGLDNVVVLKEYFDSIDLYWDTAPLY